MKLLPFEYAVRNLGRSPVRFFLSATGSTLVVLLILAASGFVRGMKESLHISASSKNVILLGAGSEESIERSQLDMRVPSLAAGSIEGIKNILGEDYISPEVHMALVINTEKNSTNEYQAILRGVTSAAYLVHPQIQITKGRAPRSGHNEIMAGELASTRMGVDEEKLSIGNTLWFDNQEWTIVGRFIAPKTVMNAEIWVPLYDMQIATKRDTLSCVVMTLDTASFDDVELWCAMRLDLELVSIPEQNYYASLYTFYKPVRIVIWVTALLIVVGGFLGGLNIMYASFAARVRELATLQTLGYTRWSIIISFLQESLLVSFGGCVIAIILSLFILDGLSVRFSMGAFAISIDKIVMNHGMIAAGFLAVLGIIPPLWRCLKLDIVSALRTA